jgi:ribosomal protein L10
MSKIIKKMELDTLKSTLNGVRDMVLLAPHKVDSALDYSLRKQLRSKGVTLKMVKNNLARKVLLEMGIDLSSAKSAWEGMTWMAFGTESIKDLSKTVDSVLKETVKKDPRAADKVKVKTAVADGVPCTLDQAMKMPTRLEAIGEIISMILGPASEIAACLTGPANQVASQIASIAEKPPEAAPATS